MKPERFFEIELKALLTKEEFERLSVELPRKLEKINEDIMHTTRYRRNGGPEDVRVRHSDKVFEIISKKGDVTRLAREEIRIPLPSRESAEYFHTVLKDAGLQADPPWIKHKVEYKISFNGFEYIVCLQHIKNFAYILEVEYVSEKDESEAHRSNIVKIIESLGCRPINPDEFSLRVKEYIKNKRVDY